MPEAPLLLVVDDAPDGRHLYVTYLRHHGYRVIEATNGVEAIEQAYSHRPDLIVMDLGMPHMDGWEATRRIKRDPRTGHIPVLAISGHVYTDAVTRATTAGADAFLPKPCRLPDLLTIVRELLKPSRGAA
jgi:two-component system, cell cycle response regulator DivK